MCLPLLLWVCVALCLCVFVSLCVCAVFAGSQEEPYSVPSQAGKQQDDAQPQHRRRLRLWRCAVCHRGVEERRRGDDLESGGGLCGWVGAPVLRVVCWRLKDAVKRKTARRYAKAEGALQSSSTKRERAKGGGKQGEAKCSVDPAIKERESKGSQRNRGRPLWAFTRCS